MELAELENLNQRRRREERREEIEWHCSFRWKRSLKVWEAGKILAKVFLILITILYLC